MEDCVFCKIIKRELPASIVFENDIVIAFMDIQPVNPGHVLVVPKEHKELITELDKELTGELIKVGTQINSAIRKSGIKCEGINYFLADGEAAGQEIFHVHLHVFPRYSGDGFGLQQSEEYYHLPKREELEETAQSIFEYL
ncbi:HIT family protein [Chryseobacterium sp. NRRL B-14859]|uniref:HIT family protein n=1 Tax=unclassified Chryseobacterium TaxID=2593645 RepID=UPI000F44AC8B|nr:HIT family protein [Chryseobacterium sp. G0240]ROI04793.1 HIT family protein [Chryseobacterium sp. G0240]